MWLPARPICLVAFPLLALLVGGSNIQPAGEFARTVDELGEAIPEGAIARLGTLRLTHVGGITSIAVSADGKMAASGVRRGDEEYFGERKVHESGAFSLHEGVRVTRATIRLWSTGSGELIRELRTTDAPVSFLQFAPDGKKLFAGCGKFVCCFDTGSGKKLWEQEAIREGRLHDGGEAVGMLLDKNTLVSLHSGRLICPVDLDGGVAFHYHVQQIVRFWNARTGAPVLVPKVLDSTIVAQTRVPVLFHEIAVSPDTKQAAIVTSEADPLPRLFDRSFEGTWKYSKRRLEVIDVAAGKILHTFADNDAQFGNLAFANDGRGLALVARNKNEIWHIGKDKSEKRLIARELPVIKEIAFSDAEHIAALVGDERQRIHVWNVRTGARLEKHHVRKQIFEPGAVGPVVAQSLGNTIALLDSKSGKPLHAFQGHRLPASLRYALHSADVLISRDSQRAIQWDTRTWKVKQVMPLPEKLDRIQWGYHLDTEFDAGISVEKGLCVHSDGKQHELRHLRTGKPVRPLKGGRGNESNFYFSAAGNRLMSRMHRWYQFYDVATGQPLAKAKGDSANVHYMWYRHPEISARGKYFANTSTRDRPAIELFDVATGKLIRKLTPRFAKDRGGSILKFHLSADERFAFGEVHEALGLENGFSAEKVSVTIWDLETGEILQDVVVVPSTRVFWRRGLSESIIDVMALSNDHRLLALTRGNREAWSRPHKAEPIEIWEVASGNKRGELKGHGPVADLAFSPNDRQLASSSDDSTILIWDLHRPLPTAKKTFSEQTLDECWASLAERDAVKAECALWKLITGDEASVAFLKKKLRPAAAPDGNRVHQLLKELDNSDFKTRTSAHEQLSDLGELITDALEAAVKQDPPLETRRRLQARLEKSRAAARPLGGNERMRQWRVLEALEKIGTAEVQSFIHELAGGAPPASLTKVANAVATRLNRRPK